MSFTKLNSFPQTASNRFNINHLEATEFSKSPGGQSLGSATQKAFKSDVLPATVPIPG